VKNLLKLFFTGLSFVFLMVNCQRQHQSSEDVTYDVIRENFSNPANLARPKVYWWCLNGNIDTVSAREELVAMKKAGIGGFDLFEIGSRDKMIPTGPAFLSAESLKMIKFVVDEAGKLGLTVGLNFASSWFCPALTLPD